MAAPVVTRRNPPDCPMLFDQSDFNVRCEWGEQGVAMLASISDVIIIVDVLSFSTAVDIAVSQGAVVFPYRWKDETTYDFARSVSAEIADGNNLNKYSLSPTSLLRLASKTRLVLPSPNGSTLCLLSNSKPTIVGCLRNCRAVAKSAMAKGRNIAVIPSGERWDDGSLRPCIEDYLGAGAIISYLHGSLSPESKTAVSVFVGATEDLFNRLIRCGSGNEKLQRNEAKDVELASELNVSSCVPILCHGALIKED